MNIATSFIGKNGAVNTAQSLAGPIGASQCLLCNTDPLTIMPLEKSSDDRCTMYFVSFLMNLTGSGFRGGPIIISVHK